MIDTRPPAISYKVRIGYVGANPMTVTITADERERQALADLWKVTKVERFEAELRLHRWKRDGIRLEGVVEAVIEQPCIVTLEPIVTTLKEPVDAVFVPEGSKLARPMVDGEGEMLIDPEGPDLPETFEGDSIDVAVAAAEFAAMAIDHYPRKDGASFEAMAQTVDLETKPPSPFAALKDWKMN
jgi:uncharacterized metal-binding protein YceD (DUF177 family)